MRYIYQDVVQDIYGGVIQGATVTIYLAGTTDAVDVYAALSGGAAVNSVLTDSSGQFAFYVDDSEYTPTQRFKIVVSKSPYVNDTIDYIKIIPDETYVYYVDATATDQGAATSETDRSLKDLIDAIGTSKKAQIILSHSGSGNTTTFTLTTSETLPSNIDLQIENGAVIDGAGTLTVDSPDKIKAGVDQQIFGSSITIVFSNAGAVYPEWWGADHSTDCATEMQAAVTSLSSAGGTLDLEKRNFRVDSTVTLVSNLTIKGGDIDFSNASIGDTLFTLTGAAGSKDSLTANAVQHALTIAVTDGSAFSAGEWLALEDTNAWSSLSTSNMGEWVLVESISSNTLTLNRSLLYSYYTAQTAQVEPFTFKENVRLCGVKITGSGASGQQYGFYAYMAKDIWIEDCRFVDIEDRAVRLNKVIRYTIKNNTFIRSNRTGLGYGISQQSCLFGTNTGNKFEYCRHSMAIGGDEFPSRYITFDNNEIIGSLSSGIDTHVPAEYIEITNNIVSGSSVLTGADGIFTSGAHIKISGNEVSGSGRNGILCRNEVTNSQVTPSYTITGNIIENCFDADNAHGIQVNQDDTGARPIKDLIISNNRIKNVGRNGIYVYARYNDIHIGTINTNIVTGVDHANYCPISITNATGFTVKYFSIIGNILQRDNDSDANIYLLGDAAGDIREVTIIGNVLNNGDNSIHCVNTDLITMHGNIISGFSTLPIIGVGSSSEIGSNGIKETVTGTVTLIPYGVSLLNSTGGAVTATLGSGLFRGQKKRIGMNNASNPSTLSVTNHETSDPEVFTFAQTTDWLVLEWQGAQWITVANSGAAT